MESSFKKYAKATQEARLKSEVLNALTTVPKDITEDPIKECLREMYKSYRSINASNYEFAIVTIVNAALTQNRKFFVLTRRNLEACLFYDKNLPRGKRKFSHERYRWVISQLHTLGICRAINAPPKRTRKKIVLEIVAPDLEKLLNLSPQECEEQREKCLKFAAIEKLELETSNNTNLKTEKPREVTHV